VDNKISQKKTAERFGVTVKTLERWRNDRRLPFPQALRINNAYTTIVQLTRQTSTTKGCMKARWTWHRIPSEMEQL
jgi:transcriptional regulator with XRE-family HTH domain